MLASFYRPLVARTTATYLLGGVGIVTVLGMVFTLVMTISQPISSSKFGSIHYTYPESHRKINNDEPTTALAPDATRLQTYKRGTCRTSTWGPEWTVDSNGGVCHHGEVGRNGCCLTRNTLPTVTQLPLPPKPISTSRSPLSSTEPHPTNTPTQDAQSTFSDNDAPRVVEALLPTTKQEEPDSRGTTGVETVIMPTCSAEHQCCGQYEFCVSSCLEFTWQRLHSVKTHSQVAKSTEPKAIDAVDRLMMDHQTADENVVKAYEEGTEDLFDWCLSRCRTSGRSVVHQNSFRSSLKYCYGTKDPPLLARNIRKGDSD